MAKTTYEISFGGTDVTVNGVKVPSSRITGMNVESLGSGQVSVLQLAARIKTVNSSSGVLSIVTALGQVSQPARPNYKFKQWLIQGTSFTKYATYNNQSVYTNPGDQVITATAQWEYIPATVSVTFNGNGGTINGQSSVTRTYTVNDVYGTLPTPVRSGYTFTGWSTNSSGYPKNLNAGSIVNQTNTRFYAGWEQNATTTNPSTQYVNVSINANGGYYGGSVTTWQKPAGSWFTLPNDNAITRAGYTLLGWSTNQYASSAGYAPGGSALIGNSDITFYAVWLYNDSSGGGNIGGTGTTYPPIIDPNPPVDPTPTIEYVTVTFNPNGGTLYGAASVQYEKGKVYNSFPTAGKTDGGTFSGWYTSSSGGSKVETSHIADGNRTLYAHYDPPKLATPTCYASPTVVKRGNAYLVNFTAVAYADTYVIEENLDGRVSTYTVSGSNSRSFTANNSFVKATYKVRAYSTPYKVYSDWSQEVTVNVDKGTAPSKPPKIRIIPTGKTESEVPAVNPVIFPNGKEHTYEVSWDQSTDAEADLDGYELEWCTVLDGVPGQYTKVVTTKPTERTYIADSATLPKNCTGIKYRVRAFDIFKNYSDWVETQAEIRWYTPPTAPPWIKVPDPPVPYIESDNSFKVSWGNSTDVDNDLVSYQIERAMNNEGFTGSALKVVKVIPDPYIYDNLPKTCTKVRYRVKAIDAQGLESGYVTSSWEDVVYNTPPTTPEWIAVKANQVKGGEYLLIEWGESTDAENNLRGYTLEYSLDGGAWTLLAAEVPFTFYDQYVVPKTAGERHDTIAFRVQAYDAYNKRSGWQYSKTYNVSNNASPVVTGQWGPDEYVGQVETGFEFAYEVWDDEHDDVDIEIYIDNKLIDVIEGAKTLYTGTYEITSRQILSLPTGMHYVTVTAKDAEGSGSWTFSFFRKGTFANLTLARPMSYPQPIRTVTFTRIEGQFPPDCIMTIEVTNNAKEGAGRVVWEDCTTEARANQEYEFKNRGQLYGWAFNFRIAVRRGPSGASGYISRISGYFDSVDETIPFSF